MQSALILAVWLVHRAGESEACAHLTCSKSFASENAYRSHMQSKRHRDRDVFLARRQLNPQTEEAAPTPDQQNDESDSEDAGSEDEEDDIEKRLAAYRRRIRPSDCLFCPIRSSTAEAAVKHMASQHSFFIPDQENLVDLPGLLSYLGEKIIIGNLCLYCPNGGKEFGSVDAARRHMIDKAHCKVAYESEEDRAELMDFYDGEVGEEEWEDVEDGEGTGQAGEESVSGPLYKSDLDSIRLLGPGWPLSHAAFRTGSWSSISQDILRSTPTSIIGSETCG